MQTRTNRTLTIQQSEQKNPTVEQLYAKFQNLKQRISNTDSRKSNGSIDRKSYYDNRRDLKAKKIYLFDVGDMKLSRQSEQLLKQQRIANKSESVAFDLIQKNLDRFLISITADIQKRFQSKVNELQLKLQRTQSSLQKLKALSKQKQEEFSAEINYKENYSSHEKNNTSCSTSLTFQTFSEDNLRHYKKTFNMETKHKQELMQVIKSYQQKLSSLVEQGKQQNDQKKLNQAFAQKTLFNIKIQAKQQELLQSINQNIQLKKLLYQYKLDLTKYQSQNLILKQQNDKKVKMTNKYNNQRIDLQSKLKNLEVDIEDLNKQLNIRNTKISKLQAQRKQKSLQMISIKQIKQVENIEINEVQYKTNSRSQLGKQVKFFDVKNKYLQFETKLLSQSCLMQQKISRQQLKNKICYKSLISQIDLYEEQNRLIKAKKDKLESQLKKNQEDEERFQQQGQVFKNQIKRLNAYAKKLDQCAFILFKGDKVTSDNIDMLQTQSLLKQEFDRLQSSKKDKKRGLSWRK